MKILRRYIRPFSTVMLLTMIVDMLMPLNSYGLTSGPTQPELQGFTPAGTSEMVDPFTGDFTYNIPLLNLEEPDGAYPFNLSYHSGITNDQESSWVGLGWSLTPGAITRNMRGVPDEFDGEEMEIIEDRKDRYMFGAKVNLAMEVFGADPGVTKSIGLKTPYIYYDSYRGIGYTLTKDFKLLSGKNVNLGVQLNLDSQKGSSITSTIGFGNNKGGLQVSGGVNSKAGLTGVTLGYTGQIKTKKGTGSYNFSSSTFNSSLFGSPSFNLGSSEQFGVHGSFDLEMGTETAGVNPHGSTKVDFSRTGLKKKGKVVKRPIYGLKFQHEAPSNDRIVLDHSREKEGTLNKDMTNLSMPSTNADVYSVTGQGIGGTFKINRNEVGIIFDPLSRTDEVGAGGSVEIGMPAPSPKFGGDAQLDYSYSKSGVWKGENVFYSDDEKLISNDGLNDKDFGYKGWKPGNALHESGYYKFNGEQTTDAISELDYIGGEEPVRFELEKKFNGQLPRDVFLKAGMVGANGNILGELDTNYNVTEDREPRNQTVKSFQKSEVLNTTNATMLNEFVVDYYNYETEPDSISVNELDEDISSLTSFKYDRGNRNDNKNDIEGFVVNNAGMRYVYALPAKNSEQVDCQFSVDNDGDPRRSLVDVESGLAKVSDNKLENDHYKVEGTNKMIKRTVLPEYPHSHMLTSILGSDYVDADDIPGPSDGDLGFWVKFEYAKVSDEFRWRAPFVGANYNDGVRSTKTDNSGSYMTGLRDEYYLSRAQTRNKIAVFSISKRIDGRGANDEDENNANLSNAGNSQALGSYSYKLDEINLFNKKQFFDNGISTTPIQTVHFDYTYDLCPKVWNADWADTSTTQHGKLTLKKVWFTFGNSDRGALSPYEFDYHEILNPGDTDAYGEIVTESRINSFENPSYASHYFDRWGQRQYQDSLFWKLEEQSASYLSRMLGLTTAELSALNDTQESDYNDKLNELWSINSPWTKQYDLDYNGAYDSFEERQNIDFSAWNLKEIKMPSGGLMKISYESDDYGYVQDYAAMQMMKIKKVYHSNSHDKLKDLNGADFRIYFDLEKPLVQAEEDEIEKYFDHRKKLYVRLSSYIRTKEESTYKELIPMWVDIDKSGEWYGLSDSTTAWVKIKPIYHDSEKYHPLQVGAWEYIRNYRPDLMDVPTNLEPKDGEDADFKAKARSLLSIGASFRQLLTGFYKYAHAKDWGKHVDLTQSYVRLCSPDRKKIGGGIRVKQITIDDNWNEVTGESSATYGTVYEYTTEEDIDGDGKKEIISSGVATYEPQIGGDETAVRYVRSYKQDVPLGLDNAIDFILPVNENLYPGPSVGYSKVTIKSLATYNEEQVQQGINTTGKIVQEFYTAKEFPVITQETSIEMIPAKLPVPIPLIGMISVNNLTGSQGYSIIKNDMHGKQKKISSYRQNLSGVYAEIPYDFVEYEYQTMDEDRFNAAGNKYFELNNEVETLTSWVDGDFTGTEAPKEDRIIGQDYEFFMDLREHFDESYSVGAQFNLETIGLGFFVIPLPSVLPILNLNRTQSRTAVTNKVITKSGVLKKVTAKSENSISVTENVLWDKQTGQVLMTKTKNNFNDDVYSLNIPGHMVYDRMGQEYQNIGFHFTSQLTTDNELWSLDGIPEDQVDLLVPGDELMVFEHGDELTARAVVNSVDYDEHTAKIYTNGTLFSSTDYEFTIFRSGRRNHITAGVGNIVALKDPTKGFNSLESDIDEYLIEMKDDQVPELKGDYGSAIAFLDTNLSKAVKSFHQFSGSGNFNEGFSASSVSDWFGPYDTSNPLKVRIRNNNNFMLLDDDRGIITNEFGVHPEEWDTLNVVDSIYCNSSGQIEVVVNRLDGQYESFSLYFPDGCAETGRGPVEELVSIRGSNLEQDSILAISAQTYSDQWSINSHNGQFTSGVKTSGFWTGEQGIWRGDAGYAYNADRNQSEALNTRTDGDMDNVPLFDWNNSLFSDFHDDWIKTGKITQYNKNGLEIESKNALGVYSAALFGFNGTLPKAVSANAKYDEIAFEDFEEYTGLTLNDPADLANTNFEFYTEDSSNGGVKTYSAEILMGNGRNLLLDFPYGGSGLSVIVSGKSIDLSKGEVFGQFGGSWEEHPDDASKSIFIIYDGEGFPFSEGEYWTGRVSLTEPTSKLNLTSYNGLEVTTSKAHTGKASLLMKPVIGNYSVLMEQVKLNLQPGEEYHFSSWVSALNDAPGMELGEVYGSSQQFSMADNYPVVFEYYDFQGNLISTSDEGIQLRGDQINGWQQVSGDFMVPEGTHSVGLRLYPVSAGLVGGAGGPVNTYFDDFRLCPKDASMSSYVYDAENFRLSATLDDNNYATYYYYDEQGNLYLTKRETERGILTIQEAMTHIREQE